MKNNKNRNIAKGIIAAGGGLTAVALRELLLSKEEHDRKEKEINRIERTKEKYMKKIGEYEPFDINKGKVTPNDGKLVNLLTRAVGVAFSNDDVFTRNKSNLRAFPFIISNNSSITSAIEVELRKYYEMLVASQVANLINHTIFSTDSVLNIKDSDRRTIDKVLDKVLNKKLDLATMGSELQQGLYENIVIEEEGDITLLSETYNAPSMFPAFDDFINNFRRVIKVFVNNDRQKIQFTNDLNNMINLRNDILNLKNRLKRFLDANHRIELVPNAVLTPAEATTRANIEECIRDVHITAFDRIEEPQIIQNLRSSISRNVNFDKNKYVDGVNLEVDLLNYVDLADDYHNLMNRAMVITANNNFSDPATESMDKDPYFRLLDLHRMENYSDSSKLLMKMFEGSSTLKVKLEMAAALLISTEILPFEFIEYATKFLGLPMKKETKLAITLKYGDGSSTNPFKFMGSEYIMTDRDDLMKFHKMMVPAIIDEKEKMVKKFTNRELRRRTGTNWFMAMFRDRTNLERRWLNKFTTTNDTINKTLLNLYNVGEEMTKKELREILSKDKSPMGKFFAKLTPRFKKTLINDLVDQQVTRYKVSEDEYYTKALSNSGTNQDNLFSKTLSLIGANGNRVNKIIEDRLKNKILDLSSIQDIDKSLDYFISPETRAEGQDPRNIFRPNLDQTQALMRAMLEEVDGKKYETTILTEDFIIGLVDKMITESYVYNLTTPTRTVTYKEVEKDPIEYVLPNYTRGRSLLYGSAEIDSDQFRNRKVGEPIWIKVTFSDKVNSMKSDMVDNDYTTVIGIKSEVHRVQEKEMEKVLREPRRSIPDLVDIFRSQRDQTLGLITKIASENEMKSASLNGILVVSINEATSNIAGKPSEDYINNPKLAVDLRKNYNLTSICLVDPIAEEYYIMEENSNSWSRLPFNELRSGSSNSDLKLLASMMGR